ncbi:MAG: ABC transporter permease [Anaerolineales bacterium]|jgi:simple sugar transport system permease protein
MKKFNWLNFGFQIGAIILALLFTTAVLLLAGAPPLQAYLSVIKGMVGSMDDITNVLSAWAPLLLTTCGVLLTFAAGLWNIGIEGQIMAGAIFTTGALRLMLNSSLPTGWILVIGFLAGLVGGAIWAALAGVLKIFGGVNEIFGGLGLNFVATAFALYLIIGPWARPGIASTSGTLMFPQKLWLPAMGNYAFSPWALGLGILVVILVFFLLRGTHFGLRLKAVGKNVKAAFLMGVPTWQYSMMAFLICGAFAGLAGAIQVTSVYHRLTPAISSGYGFLGLLVAMLINYQALWAAPVTLFFAALNIGGIQLPIILKLDSSLSGVLQETLVLFVLLVEGARQNLFRKR